MEKNNKRESISNLLSPFYNINVVNKVSYNFENQKDFIVPKNRRDSILEEELKKKDKLYINEEIVEKKNNHELSYRSLSMSINNNPQIIFSNENYDEIGKVEKTEKIVNEEINFNTEVKSLIESEKKLREKIIDTNEEKEKEKEKLNIKIKLKKEESIENIDNKKIKKYNKLSNQIKLNELEKIEIKLPKTRRYWLKDNYYLIPNVFKLLTPIEKEFYIEHHDYCRKEILVQTNGEKVTDYISTIKKNKLNK